MSKYVFGFKNIGWCPIEFDSREEVMLAGDKHKYRSGRDLYVGEKHLCWPEIDINKILANIKDQFADGIRVIDLDPSYRDFAKFAKNITHQIEEYLESVGFGFEEWYTVSNIRVVQKND